MKFLFALGVLVFGCSLEKNIIACGFQPPLPSDMLAQVIQISDEPVPFFLQRDENVIATVSNSGYIKFIDLALTQEIFSGHCLDGLEADSSEEESKSRSKKKETIKKVYSDGRLPVCAVFYDVDAKPLESSLFPFKIVLRDGTVLRWDPGLKVCAEICKGDGDRYSAAAQLHDGRIALASEEFCIKIIDPGNSGTVSKTMGLHDREINALVQCEENLLASASDDGTVKVWDLESGECVFLFGEKSDYEVDALIKLSDGRLAFGLTSGFVVVWNPRTGAVIPLKGQPGEVTRLVQLSEKNIASASTDGSINVQNISSRQNWLTLHDSLTVCGLFRLLDGRFISSDLMGQISIWDIHTASEPHTECTIL